MTARPFRAALAAFAAAAALGVGASQAQVVGDSNAPIDITANNLELIDAQRVQIWRGAVEAVQGQNRLRTTELRVFHAPKAGGQPSSGGNAQLGDWGEARRMLAQGDVYFVTPDTVARGTTGDYDLVRDVITISGNVILTRGENVLRGDRLVIDVASGRSTMESNTPGRGNQRVRGVFYPEQRAAQPAAAPRPAG